MNSNQTGLLAGMEINEPLTRSLITRFLRNELGKFEIHRVVVGLSGGVDSALAAHLAVEALGPENVLAVSMPYGDSAPECTADALTAATGLGIQCLKVNIAPMVDPLLQMFPDMSPKRRGNIMARERMIVLFDQSEAFGPSVVLGTSNKTETLVGYFTLHGDGAAGIEPISDLYKTQVWQLAKAMGVPQSIIDRVPTAGLWPGQTDEGEMGISYAELDKMLYLLVDRQLAPEQLVKAGFEDKIVRRVVNMVRSTEYKRHLPVAAKLTGASLAHDLTYPRDWGK